MVNITESQRLSLRAKFNDVLGSDLAEIAMRSMPPLDYDQIVTKTDLDVVACELRTETATSGSELRQEMAVLGADLRTEMAELRIDLGNDISQLRDDVRAELQRTFHWMVGFMLTMFAMLGTVLFNVI